MKEIDQFLDADDMQKVLQRQYAEQNLMIEDCQILQTRLKTHLNEQSRGKANISVCYQIKFTDERQQKCGTQILFLKAYLENRSRGEFQKIDSEQLVTPDFGEPLVHLPELDAIVWAFPNDPALPHLPEVSDPHKVKKYLPYGQLPAEVDAPEKLAEVNIEVIHYYPEQRCISRYELQGKSIHSPAFALFGKTFKDDQGAELHQRMKQLWQRSLAHPQSFVMAQPLGYNDAIKTVWQKGLAGQPLNKVIDQDNYQPLLAMVAQGLADLHQSDLYSPVKIKLDWYLSEIRKKSAKLVQSFPRLQEEIQSLATVLEQTAPRAGAIPATLIHGDFHLHQLLMHEGKIALFDFDELAMGDPLQDLASFMVDLWLYDFEPGLVKSMARFFFDSYCAQAAWEAPRERLNWHIRQQIFTKAYREQTYRRRKSSMDDRVESILDLVDLACVERQF